MKRMLIMTCVIGLILLIGCVTKEIKPISQRYQCQDHCDMIYIDDFKQLQIQCHYNSTIYEVENGQRCNQITQVFRLHPDTNDSDGFGDYPID